MSLLRTFRKCYDLAPSYVSKSHSHYLPRNVVNVTRLKPVQLSHRFYSEAKPKENQNGSTQDNSQTSAPDSQNNLKTEPETSDTQKLDREAEFATQLQAKQDEIVELTGRLRYAQADFINLQRISAREKEQTKDFAISRFAADLLETADTLTMALRSVPPSNETTSNESSSSPAYFQRSTQTSDALLQGVEATHRILLQTLAKYGVKPFDPTGETFDPNRHEALYSAPIPGKPAGEILNCQKLGYMIRDRVLRAAQVGVAAEHPAEPKEGK
ncbi:hypothetical protein Clacol_006656 [Clathrus columnatus]|uniref:GrpE protein homolog, mitochondrial n=1 Tax=Clathrus columnatus TaxID=1419009 RepID=A0AAV5AIB3_9AGAM|nr:hypothetical protein Clacol_006656 [Clathrus columnatus]